VPDPLSQAGHRPAPFDCNHRLLLDPFLCVGPGCETHADTLFEIVQRAAALGITLCVEREAWLEALVDPDVRRRRIDLGRFEPLVKLGSLPLPSERDASARFQAPRGETDVADLKLLGALHARVADQLVALDGRLHRLAARAGLGARVLLPADALAWLNALAGHRNLVTLRELDPASALDDAGLAGLLGEECEPFDPYLRSRLQAGRGRVLAAFRDDRPLAVGVVETRAQDDHLALTALAATEAERGAGALEPVVAAALGIARRRRVPLEALLPPHEETVLLLLEQLSFAQRGADAHGRLALRHLPEPVATRLDAGMAAWWLPLDAQAHDQLLPELAGAPQAQLFAVGAGSLPQTVGSAVRKHLLFGPLREAPVSGDHLLVFHAKAGRRPASSSITAMARVDQATRCERLEEVLELDASRPGRSLEEIRRRLEQGPVTVLGLTMAGRLERFLPLSWLRENGVLPSPPRTLRRIEPAHWEALAPRLVLA
jgi:hypothetical protein